MDDFYKLVCPILPLVREGAIRRHVNALSKFTKHQIIIAVGETGSGILLGYRNLLSFRHAADKTENYRMYATSTSCCHVCSEACS
jgi:hypothetical protein